MSQFTVPSRILLGENIIDQSGILSGYGHKALIVTGKHIVKSSMMSRLLAALQRDGIEYAIFDGITGEPTDTMIESGIKAYRDGNCDFCIGIGGGSPLDSAKAIAAMITNPGTIADYNGKTITTPVPPVVAIPTTAGTGSEATKFTIITDTAHGIKMLLKGDVLLPTAAIVDFSFGLDAPQSVTVATGLDALTHAIESFISRKAMPLTDSYAVSAVKRIMKYLPLAYSHGSKAPDARREMAIAALEAGICINNSSVTVVHGMSRPIGALFHVPHGISNAMLLVTCLNDLKADAAPRLASLERAIHPEEFALADAELAERFIGNVTALCRICQVPSLKAYGIPEDAFMSALDKMSADAIASGSPANAPKDYTAADCRRLYQHAFNA